MKFSPLRKLFAKIITRLDVSSVAQQFEFNDYVPNDIVRVIINCLTGLIIVVGVAYGGYTMAMGFISEEPREKRNGLTAILSSIVIGSLILIIVNMVIK